MGRKVSHLLNIFVLEQEKSRLYTWITPADLSLTDIDPNHIVLVAKIYTKLKKTIKFQKGGKNKVGSGEGTGSTTESARHSG